MEAKRLRRFWVFAQLAGLTAGLSLSSTSVWAGASLVEVDPRDARARCWAQLTLPGLHEEKGLEVQKRWVEFVESAIKPNAHITVNRVQEQALEAQFHRHRDAWREYGVNFESPEAYFNAAKNFGASKDDARIFTFVTLAFPDDPTATADPTPSDRKPDRSLKLRVQVDFVRERVLVVGAESGRLLRYLAFRPEYGDASLANYLFYNLYLRIGPEESLRYAPALAGIR